MVSRRSIGLICVAGFGVLVAFVLWRSSPSQRALRDLAALPQLNREASQLLAAGRPDAALAKLAVVIPSREMHGDSPRSPRDSEFERALVIVGRAHLALNRPAAAIGALDRINNGRAAWEIARFPLAQALVADGQWDRAYGFLFEQVAAHPDDRAALDETRWFLFNLMQNRAALSVLEKRLATGDLTALPDLIDTEFRAQIPQEGLARLRAVDVRHPGQPRVRLAIAICRWRLGELDAARGLMSDVLSKLPDDPETQLATAEFHLECGDVDTAVSLLGTPNEARASAFSLDLRQREQFWSLQSQILERREEVQQSLDLMDRAIALSPDRLDFLVRRATLLRLLSRSDEAVAASRAAENFRRSENQLRELFRRGTHHHPTREDCTLLSQLCGELGRESQAKGWQQLASSR